MPDLTCLEICAGAGGQSLGWSRPALRMWPPFSIAGKQLGADDERDLFPQALRLVEECGPAAVMLENVRGLSTARFASYREQVLERLHDLGYETDWLVLNASEFARPGSSCSAGALAARRVSQPP